MIKTPELNYKGFLYLHEGNHNEIGDPHKQYVLKPDQYRDIGISENLSAGKWTEICTFTVYRNTSTRSGFLQLKLINGVSQSAVKFYDVFFKFSYVYPGDTLTITLNVTKGNPANFSVVSKIDENGVYQITLFGKNDNNYGNFHVVTIAKYMTSTVIVMYETSLKFGSGAWLAALPAGTVTNHTGFSDVGIATMLSGTTSIVVSHSLGYTPKIALVTPTSNIGYVWVTGLTWNAFTINCSIAPPSNASIYYKLE